MPGWSPYGLPGKCEKLNLPGAWNVRTSELYHLSSFVYGTPITKYDRTQAMFPAFSINCMLPPSPLFLGNAPFPWKLCCCVICGKGEARRVQPDYKQLYLYQSPEQAFALGLSSPWEGARGRNRKTRKAYFAFVVFHGRGSEWYAKYHPSPMQQQHITQQPKKIIWGSISWCEWRAHRKQQREPEWVRSPPFPLKFERSNFYPGNFSKLIL